MLDRFPLKSALFVGVCIAVPLSSATGDNVTNFPSVGAVLPNGSTGGATMVVPVSAQDVMPSFIPAAPAALPAAAPVVPSAPTVLPVATAPVQAVLPVQVAPSAVQPTSAQQAMPVIRDVPPGQNPFAPSQQTQSVPPQSAPGVQPLAQTPQLAAPMTSDNSVEAQIAKLAQETENPQASPSAKPAVDETALRYYAQTRDLKRLGAELRRLKTLYPEWDAPENLFDAPTNISEQPLWDIFGQGDYVRVRTEMAKLQSENPNWKPSQELLDKLSLGETRKLMERSYALSNWRQVVTLAEATPQLMVCSEMNTMWITAESLAQSRDFARAFELYKHILTTCDNPNERLSTVQKASLLLPEAGTRSLVALGNILPDGTGEFDNVSFDFIRRKMGLVAQGNAAATGVSIDELQRFSDFVQRAFSANDAELFGWFYYGQQNWEASYSWFAAATRMTNNPKSVEGVILSLRNLDHREEALQLSRQYAGQTSELKKIYIELISAGLTDQETPLALEEEELKTFETYVFELKSALGAQALGWHRLETKETKEASRLFEQSVEWEPTEGGVTGLAVMAARAKNWKRVAAIKSEYGEKFASLDDIKVYRPKVSQKKAKPTKLTAEKPNLLTWLFNKDSRNQKTARVETE